MFWKENEITRFCLIHSLHFLLGLKDCSSLENRFLWKLKIANWNLTLVGKNVGKYFYKKKEFHTLYKKNFVLRKYSIELQGIPTRTFSASFNWLCICNISFSSFAISSFNLLISLSTSICVKASLKRKEFYLSIPYLDIKNVARCKVCMFLQYFISKNTKTL